MGAIDSWTPLSSFYRENIRNAQLQKINTFATAEFEIAPGTHTLFRWHNLAYKLLEKVLLPVSSYRAEKGLLAKTIDFRSIYVSLTRACVILEEIIPEHSEFDIANNDKGYSSFRDEILNLLRKESDKLWKLLEYKILSIEQINSPYILAKITEGKQKLVLVLPIDLDYPTFLEEWHSAKQRTLSPQPSPSFETSDSLATEIAFRIWYDGLPQDSLTGSKNFIKSFEKYKRTHSLPATSSLRSFLRRLSSNSSKVSPPCMITPKFDIPPSVTYWVLYSKMNPFERRALGEKITDERCLVRKLNAPVYRSVWLFATPLVFPLEDMRRSSKGFRESVWFVFVTTLEEGDFVPVLTGKRPLWEGIQGLSLGDVFKVTRDGEGEVKVKVMERVLSKDIGIWEMVSGELVGRTILSTNQIKNQANDIVNDLPKDVSLSQSSLNLSQSLIHNLTGTPIPPTMPQGILSRLYTPQKIRPNKLYIPGSLIPSNKPSRNSISAMTVAQSTASTTVQHSTYFSVTTGYSTSFFTAEEIPGPVPLSENRMSLNLEDAAQRIKNAAGGIGVIDLEWIIP